MEIDTNSSTTTTTVDSLLQSYPSLQRIPDKDRIKCMWTQHEMPARVDAIEKYVQGKKYQQFLKKTQKNDLLVKFREFLEPSTKKDHERQLFCKLTWRHINKEPHHILKHIEGKRFQKAYVHWQECQKNGTQYVPLGRKKKTTKQNDNAEDDDEYVDLSDDEIVVEDDDDDDLSDLYPDFRRLRASDGKPINTTSTNDQQEETTGGTKRKAQKSELKKPKKLGAPSSKRMRPSDETISNEDVLVKPTKTMTITM